MNKNIFPINNHNIRKILEETSKRDFALLGESTHGTKEFYEIRLLITKLLVKNHNFNTIFLETEWSNGYILNKYIHSKISIDIKILLPKIFNKFPKWMTCNKYIHNLLIFLKSWNRINKKKVYIYGIDCQDIELAKKNVCNKSDLNCPIVSEIIKNYDIMNNPELNYWNIRDKFWLNIINSVKKYRKSKFILWAHNSHVGLSSANIRNDNNINIGYLLQQLYNIYIIGFSTAKGNVLASKDWGENGKIMKILEPIKNSFEHEFEKISKKLNVNRFIYVCNKKQNIIKYFRYIGVVYDKNNEFYAHYVKTDLNKEYDIIFFINNSNALDNCEIT